jgi:histidine triad (HIT) family protein
VAPESTLFQKIIDGQIPSKKVYEDDQAVAFRDISPQAPAHVIIISKTLKIGRVHERAVGDEEATKALGHLMLVAGKIAKDEQLVEGGYRLVVNQGEAAGQTVIYLHMHLLGGREFSWPPG